MKIIELTHFLMPRKSTKVMGVLMRKSIVLDKYHYSYIFCSVKRNRGISPEISHGTGRQKFWIRSSYGRRLSNRHRCLGSRSHSNRHAHHAGNGPADSAVANPSQSVGN